MDGNFAMEDDAYEKEEESQTHERNEKLTGLVDSLAKEAKRRVDRRSMVEQRWISDLQQYHGIYDDEIVKKLAVVKGSQIFMNMTAPKTDTLIARLFDLLFPTDDKNWSIGPTPVPELTQQAAAAVKRLDELTAQADGLQGQAEEVAGQPGATQDQVNAIESQKRAVEEQEQGARAEHDRLQKILDEASRRAQLMEREIEDQLQQCNMPAQARKTISDGCKIGFGVLKGPVIGNRGRRQWVTDAQGNYALNYVQNNDPAAQWVDPWSYFPDPDVADVADGRGDLERHLLTADKLRRLAVERDDIDKDVVRDLLKQKPTEMMPAYKASINALTGANDATLGTPLYHVWEYTGPVETEDMQTLVEAFTK